MTYRPLALVPIVLWLAASVSPAAAGSGDGLLCQAATSRAERSSGVPDQLLGAISRVESGRLDPETGTLRAWPWTINAQGVGHFYETKADAVAAVRAFQAAGIRSIDVGCAQINLMFHPDGFASLDQAFDPLANATFAAQFLTDLFHQTGSWPHAAAAYHSQTPDLGSDYQRKVLDVWAQPVDRPADTEGRPSTGARRAGAAGTIAQDRTAGSAVSAPFGNRPLGGFGHIIRNGPITAPPVAGIGVVPGSLAAYRARPVALASMPIPPS